MGNYQPFGYKDEPGTCLWCGRKLQYKSVAAEPGEPGAKEVSTHFWSKRADKAGAYQDDSFCGLNCGYRFGRRMAELGRRLVAAS